MPMYPSAVPSVESSLARAMALRRICSMSFLLGWWLGSRGANSAVVVTAEVCGARRPEAVNALNMVMLCGVD